MNTKSEASDRRPFNNQGLRDSINSEIDIRELEITIDRINELNEEEEEDEYGEVVHPTEYAIQKAIELVTQAAHSIPGEFFKAWVSEENDGGIRLTWSKPELKKQVRLVVPATLSQKIYLYHEKGDEYGVQYNISANTLSNRLKWLNSSQITLILLSCHIPKTI